MLLLLATLCAAALPITTATTVCGKQELHSRIFGGNTAFPGEFPWHAILTFNGKPYCGGSLISESWILTASHCFDRTATEDKRDPKLWRVHLGFTKMGYVPAESSGITVVPSRIIIHESYTRYTEGSDIALVELSQPVTFNRFISPICVPESTHRFHLRSSCYATGLEDVPEGVPLDSKRSLEKVRQTLIGWRTCNCIYNTHMRPDLNNPAKPGMLCISESDGKAGPCLGDSGGPVVCNEDGVWFLAGAISFSQGCHLLNSPTIISSVSFYQDWIKRNTNNKASFTPQTIVVTDDTDNDTCSDLLSNQTTGCGVSQVGDPSSGRPGSWPWQVDLWREGERACSGALISASWVVTAAQCFIRPGSSDAPEDWSVTVSAGTPAVREVAVQKISIHGSYINPERGFNVALVLLAQPVPMGPYSQPICLPDSSHQMPYGSSCWHVGGNNSVSDEEGAPVAEKLELIGPNQCNCIYSRPNSSNRSASILDGMICAMSGNGSSSHCLLQRDFGGPLVCKQNSTWFLIGLQSFGGGCGTEAERTLPVVFTQLTQYGDWIDKQTREPFFRPVISAAPPKPDTDRCSPDSPRVCGRSVASPGPEPVGEATEKTWPWQVSLQRYGAHVCSGVLISETWLLTAAHCVPSYTSASDYTVVLGRQRQDAPNPREVSRAIRRVVLQPDYKVKTGENDLALVEMKYGVTFSDFILPICLPADQSASPAGECWAPGWGRVYPSGSTSPRPPLRNLQASLLDGKDCGSLGNTTQFGEAGQICVAHKNNNAFSCLLDSSAPLVCQTSPKGHWLLFGVGSQTSPPKRNACPSNFSSVVPKLSWIRGVVPRKDLASLERNTTVEEPGHNDTVAPQNSTETAPTVPNTTLGPQSANTTYRGDDMSTGSAHNGTAATTETSCLDNTSGLNCTSYTTVTPQLSTVTPQLSTVTPQLSTVTPQLSTVTPQLSTVTNSIHSSSRPTHPANTTVKPTAASGADSLWSCWSFLLPAIFSHLC